MAEILSAGVHRPRNVDWQRAAALLYGDWGTSKAYVLGLAFVAAGFASGPINLAVCLLPALGILNHFGPKHSGSVSIWLAVPAVIVVVATIAFSSRYLNLAHLEPRHTDLETLWVQFVGVILALSGVEAIANLTGVMKLDPGATAAAPKVTRTATKAILPVAIEVVCGTALLGWAMLSLPKSFAPELISHKEDMLRF